MTMQRLGERPADHFARLKSLGPLDRIEAVRKGIGPELPTALAEEMGMPKSELFEILGLAPATVNRKRRRGQPLSQEESERVLGVVTLIGLVERIVEESGEPEGFEAAQWFGAWIERPQQTLAGKRPVEILDSAEGRQMISDLLHRSQTSTYA